MRHIGGLVLGWNCGNQSSVSNFGPTNHKNRKFIWNSFSEFPELILKYGWVPANFPERELAAYVASQVFYHCTQMFVGCSAPGPNLAHFHWNSASKHLKWIYLNEKHSHDRFWSSGHHWSHPACVFRWVVFVTLDPGFWTENMQQQLLSKQNPDLWFPISGLFGSQFCFVSMFMNTKRHQIFGKWISQPPISVGILHWSIRDKLKSHSIVRSTFWNFRRRDLEFGLEFQYSV